MRIRFLWVFLVGGVLFFQTMIIPIGNGPDDDFHLTSIWCANGYQSGICEQVESGVDPSFASVPIQISNSRCYVGNLSASSSCLISANDSSMSPVRGGLSGEVSTNLFYRALNSVVTVDTTQSLVLVRIVNILIFLMLLGFLAALLPNRDFIRLKIVTIIGLFPFGFYLFSTVNPSVWLILGIPIFWFSFQGLLASSRTRGQFIVFGVASLTSLVLMVGARSDGIYVVITLTLFGLIINQVTKRGLTLGSAFLLSAFGLQRAMSTPTVSLNLQGVTQSPNDEANWMHNILELPIFMLGLFGGRGEQGTLGLGAYDFPLPSIVAVSAYTSLILILSKLDLSRKEFLISAVAFFLIPFSALYGLNVYETWPGGLFQPRYILPFFIIFIAVAVSGANSCKQFLLKSHSRILIFLLSIASVSYSYATLKRYSEGLNVISDAYLDMHFWNKAFVGRERIEWTSLLVENWLSFTVFGGILVALMFVTFRFSKKDLSSDLT